MEVSMTFAAIINTIRAPRWKVWLAKMLGDRAVTEDCGWRLTTHTWGGVAYVTKYERSRRNNMLSNKEINEYETLLQRQADGDTLSLTEQDRLYQLEQKAAYHGEEE
jgi:hypothetical protein